MRMEKWAYTRVRWDQVRGRRGYLVVDLSPDVTLGAVVLKSLYAIDANVEICGVENWHHRESVLRCTVIWDGDWGR